MIVRLWLVLVVLASASVVAGLALASPESGSACARGYSPCLPARADLDCADIPDARKPVRVTGADPYGLDADRDGLGCEISGEGGGRQSPWGLILRKGKKEATSAKVGDTLTVVAWSPSSFRGERDWQLCIGSPCSEALIVNAPLRGRVEVLVRVRIRPRNVANGVFKVGLNVANKNRASDTVPVR